MSSVSRIKCIRCGVPKLKSEYAKSYTSDGVIGACKVCVSTRKNELASKQSLDKLMSYTAPRNAAKLLIDQNPEALAELVRRFREPYMKLLEEERERLIERRVVYMERQKATRIKRAKKAKDE